MASATVTRKPSPIHEVVLTLSEKEAEFLEALLGQFGDESDTLHIFCALGKALEDSLSPESSSRRHSLKKKARAAIEIRAKIAPFCL